MRAPGSAGALGLCAGLLFTPVSAPAQRHPPAAPTAAGDIDVKTQVSAQEVEVGERVVVTVTALSSQDGPSPSSPNLPVQGDAEVHGPSVRTEFRMFSDGRTMQRQQGLTATWTLTPTQPGTLVIGPATFQAGGRAVSGQRVTVKVLPASGTPRRSPPPSMGRGRPWPDPLDFDPFDWFQRRRLPGRDPSPFPDWLEPQVPAELRMDRAPDPIGFARMTLTPRRVVVGEQVTLRVYAYGGRGPFNVGFATQPATVDFLSFPLEHHDIVPHRVPIGDQVFHAAKIREMALIPLKTGELTIGAAELTLNGRGYPATGAQGGYLAPTQELTIQVVEPPLNGRPPGYSLGDVGRYTLKAEVEPRKIEQGDYISVVARLKGTGHVPSKLTPAENQALEWLEPSVSGEVEAQGSGVGGERVFRWTVRVKDAGTVELGELRLPYYDPERRRYETARADLGTIQAAPRASNDALEDAALERKEPDDLLPRAELGAFPQAERSLADTPYFWWAVAGVPLSLPLLGAVDRALQGLLARRRKQTSDAKSRVKGHLAEAARRRKDGAPEQAAAHFERAVYEAIEHATGLKARGILRERLASVLEEHGIQRTLSDEIVSLIEQLEALRFTGRGDDEPLAEGAQRVARALLSERKSRPKAR